MTPPLSLGILDSITRRAVLEVWPDVIEKTDVLEAVLEADEVFVMSTVKEVSPVVAIGDKRFEPGPVTREVHQRFRALVGQ
jgi:branched-subunit amino acid aminotransferase/4-amino-4-deoxychorismate lyase